MPTNEYNKSRLVALWEEAASDLGLEIVTPFELTLASGARILVPVLVHHFGALKGMLVLSDYSLIRSVIEEITQAGYGFSVLSEPNEARVYVRVDYIKLLMDWGWAGPESSKPLWLNP
jgi:hypothetical protein